MLQENHSFDNYFGMLNPYRAANGYSVGDDGITYTVDGIDDKLTTISNQDDEGTTYKLFKLASTCVDDESSDWLASYGDVNRYDFLTYASDPAERLRAQRGRLRRQLRIIPASCSGTFTDLTGERAMGYYDRGISQLLLLHGLAVRAVESLVLAGIGQEHRQPDRDLHRRHDPGPGA